MDFSLAPMFASFSSSGACAANAPRNTEARAMNIPAFQRYPALTYFFAFSASGFSTNARVLGEMYPKHVAG